MGTKIEKKQMEKIKGRGRGRSKKKKGREREEGYEGKPEK